MAALKVDGTANYAPGPNATDTFGDAYKRHLYTSSIWLTNPAGRRTL